MHQNESIIIALLRTQKSEEATAALSEAGKLPSLVRTHKLREQSGWTSITLQIPVQSSNNDKA